MSGSASSEIGIKRPLEACAESTCAHKVWPRLVVLTLGKTLALPH
jgi:hypothetical protein